MTTRIFIPRDSSALSVGAEQTAKAIERAAATRKLDIAIVRNGSRGMLWLEPMIEVETPAGRIAYGPVSANDVDGLFDAGLVSGGTHKLRLGKPEEIPYFKNQERLTFARCGITDPLSIEDYRAHDGYKGLKRAL